MKLRHAAALALVGWYLMAPPLQSGWLWRTAYRLGWVKEVPVRVQTDAPISEWAIEGSFDSAQECTRGKTENLEDTKKMKFRLGDPLFDQALSAECIATDDPRLKGK